MDLQPDLQDARIVGYVKTVVPITDEDIENIIISAFEGGSNYWAGLRFTTDWKDRPSDQPHSTWAAKLLLEGKTILLYDIEDSQSEFALTLKDLLYGIVKNFEERPFSYDKEQWDADDCDCILQYSLFNELMFN